MAMRRCFGQALGSIRICALLDFANMDAPDFDANCSVASMVTADGQWDFPRLERLLTPEVVDVVAGMSPPQANRGADDWVWGLEKSGVFSIKSAYNLISQINSYPEPALWKVVWKWKGPNRIKHFLWLAAKDKLLTNEGRRRRGLCSNAICNWCGSDAETVEHVLRDCEFANSTWRAVGGFDLTGLDWKLAIKDWFMSLLADNRGLRFGVVCWFLWRARNERLFAGSVEGANAIAARCLCWEGKVGEALNFERDCLESGRKNRQIQVAWQAGPEGWLILGNCSITRAEIRGALEGIRAAWREGFRKVEEQIDSQAAIAILLDKNQLLDHQHGIEVLEFRDWVAKDWDLRLKHIYREANQAADYLANLGHTLPMGCHSISCSDCNLAYHVRYDCMGISEPRLIN
ncbi:Putative ribonuclease H protein At1g65750 [Linum perenne]